ncbi:MULTISPECIES: division/cell wall cluster transcriptional repressor MraZ [Gammaproteobacteria]|uniref:Transcriptional regulator MraZ n=2 Tax=Vreelandella halophila TaxID=86177 RepID=A0A9X5B5Y1_9GAMM|nr:MULTISPECIES: division/cell wall cluster transcriptional repressor MraZ [Gammaproteobacteria]KAA8980674.1 division/cell wall cluster transcriptional repressor MraZ [Halospina sp. K52047b]MYL26667.1 division/cell wall cluster transcriptional repressor MraZ [Halomonas utahensis]MYL74004.1 division/cell wall cluster transcriptional repressor MraZ [Halomonas sp. 22501_18_FS]
MTNFLGSHAINMDAKGRLAIPARVREDLETLCGGRIVLTAHTEERCLLVYPEPQWEEILPKIEALPSFNKAVRRTQRLLIGYATPLELDGAGRILVPQPLRDYAGLEKKLYLVGQGRKLELWSEDRWMAWLEEDDGDEEIPEEMKSLSL